MRALTCIACLVTIGSLTASAHAQEAELPASVRLLVPTCARGLPWRALSRALEVELRTMGSSLATDEADLRLALDLPCEGEPTEAEVTLVHVASGRARTERVSLGEARGIDRVRTLALGLSEIIRLRYAGLTREPEPPPALPPPPPPEAVVDVGRFEAQITRAANEAVRLSQPPPEPEPPAPPDVLFDLSFGINGYPAANNASAEGRAGFSFRTPSFRLGFDVIFGGGWASSLLGEVALGGLGAGVAVRFAYAEPDWLLAAGLRIDGSWVRASGVGDLMAGFDAVHLAALLDARIRFRVGEDVWFLLTPEVGAALVGVDVRLTDVEGRRVTAQVGPRIGLSVGMSLDVH